MTRNRFQTILLTATAVALIITALPESLQAYWEGGRSTRSGCNMCLCIQMGADCDNPEHRNHSGESVSGITCSGDGTPVRYEVSVP
ncbi:MAG: hypothetical protein GY749_09570 [Desulfobacteraceae bacterium]|nr:hypothetical protein [Desulfobacteraceae bacterium]